MNKEIVKDRNRVNMGINDSMIKGFQFLYPKCDFLVTLDSDVELKRDWLIKLNEAYEEGKRVFPNAKDFLVTGFNCTSTCTHKIKKTYPKFHTKNTIGGINMFYHKNIYNNIIDSIRRSKKGKNHGWDWGVCHYCNTHNIPILVTNPSVVQHIGITGVNSRGRRVDMAEDF